MKYLNLTLVFILVSSLCVGQSKSHEKLRTKKIQWKTLEEAIEEMKITPKKVYIDIYHEGDGWCIRMQEKVFTNKFLIDYLNENFYAIHLNAETADTLFFKGKKYFSMKDSKVNELAAEFMQNKISYPFSVFFDETFSNPQPIPGYLDLPNMELILKYIASDKYKKVRFDKFKETFKSTWK